MSAKTRNGILLYIGVIALGGCELFQPRVETEGDGPPPVMMIADTVPLAGERRTPRAGKPLPVPEEPSPFEHEAKGLPHAMKSDLETRPARNHDAPREIPKEPIPSANPEG